MSPAFRLAAALVLAAGMAGAPPLSAEETAKPSVPQVASGQIVWWGDFQPGRAVGVSDVWVWLPPGYAAHPAKRFPVLYMHDGQNLFDPKLAGYGKVWGMDEAIARLSAQGDLREWIVVGIASPAERYRTLFPEKLFDLLPAQRQLAVFETDDPAALDRDALKGDEYLAFLVRDLKPAIDAGFRTLPGKDDTAVMGASMGALASLYAMGEYPEVFGAAAALSNPLMLTLTEGLDPASDTALISDVWASWLDGTRLRPGGGNRLFSDTGMVGMDASFAPYLDGFDRMMAARGWRAGDYQSRRFLGAEHDELYWHQRVDIPLAFIDRADP